MINIFLKIYDFKSTSNHFHRLFHMNVKGQPFKLSTCLHLPYYPIHTSNLVILKACLWQIVIPIFFPTAHSLTKIIFSPTFMCLPWRLCSWLVHIAYQYNGFSNRHASKMKGVPLVSILHIEYIKIKLSYPWTCLCNEGFTPTLPSACSIVI